MKAPLTRFRLTTQNPLTTAAPEWIEVRIDDVFEEGIEYPKQSEQTASLGSGTPEQSSVAVTCALPIANAPESVLAMRSGWLELTGSDGDAVVVGGRMGARIGRVQNDALDAFGLTLIQARRAGAGALIKAQHVRLAAVLSSGGTYDEADEPDIAEALLPILVAEAAQAG